jgi:hypothetical protein
MVFTGKTALVINPPLYVKSQGNFTEQYYRLRSCDTNLNTNTPATQYQIQKRIQNTVRVPASIYTMNLAGLNAYENPDSKSQTIYLNGSYYQTGGKVNWNQMSDRKQPHNQVVVTASGSTYGGNSLKRSLVRLRPGAMSPGGVGCDIKHNSYDRYLNRIKGKAPLRRGPIPPDYGSKIAFNRAYPIYGGKTVKTNIVNNCKCPITDENTNIYQNEIISNIDEVNYIFHLGNEVYIFIGNTLEHGVIINIDKGIYTIELDNKSTVTATVFELSPYFNCNNCYNEPVKEYNVGYNNIYYNSGNLENVANCILDASLII